MNGEVRYPQVTHQIAGNTAGATALISSGTMVIAGGNNVTLSQDQNTVSIIGGAGGPGGGGIAASAGTQLATSGTVSFANSNGISFGMSNSSIITATVKTDYQTSGNYLTTARASNDAIGLNTAKTNATWTVNSSGFSFDGGAYLTTAQPVGAYLTTARASNDAVGLNTAATSVTWTVNSSGISLNAGAYLTTAAQSNHSHGNPTLALTNLTGTTASASNGFTLSLSGNAAQTNQNISLYALGNTTQNSSTLLNASNLSINAIGSLTAGYSNGSIQLSAPNALTSQSNQNVTAANGGFAFQTLSFSNLNGISFGTSAGSAITASHNALTTARASTDAIGLNTAQSNVTWTANSSGLSLDARGYAGTGTSATNASVTLNSNGLAVSVAAPGGGAAVTVSASNGSFTVGNLNFSNANNVTFGTSAGSIVTASVAAPGAAAENNNHNLLGANTAGNTTASGSTIGLSGINITLSGTNGSAINISAPATSSLSATGQVSLSTNGSTISIGVPKPVTYSRYNEFKESPLVAGQIGDASLHLQPWIIPNLQYDRVVLHKAFSNATNSSFSFTVSDWVGIYTKTGNSFSLLQSTSISTNFSGSGTAGSYLSYGGGIKAQTIGMTNTLTEGMYWIGIIQRTTTGGGAGHTLYQALNSNMNSSYRGLMGAATNATNQMSTGFGVYTVTTSGMPGSIAATEIQGNSSVFLRPPSMYFVSGTV